MVMAPLFPGATKKTEWKPIIPPLAGSLIATPLGVYILLILSLDTMSVLIALLVIGSVILMTSGLTYQGNKTTLLSFGVG